MDIKETGKKLKPFAPVLSVALVTACVAGSLSGYEAPVYAATQEETPVKKEEQQKIAEMNAQAQLMQQNAQQFLNGDPDAQSSQMLEAEQQVEQQPTEEEPVEEVPTEEDNQAQ